MLMLLTLLCLSAVMVFSDLLLMLLPRTLQKSVLGEVLSYLSGDPAVELVCKYWKAVSRETR
jgi:hypothetical protein